MTQEECLWRTAENEERFAIRHLPLVETLVVIIKRPRHEKYGHSLT
jgi:hypothetical protein